MDAKLRAFRKRAEEENRRRQVPLDGLFPLIGLDHMTVAIASPLDELPGDRPQIREEQARHDGKRYGYLQAKAHLSQHEGRRGEEDSPTGPFASA